ncbi:Pre-mRNA-splicing factor cwf19 [Pleurostoma richardsiae]|uniref:Pre-mRNA-splicing factor cwf19 n=1 Tax=Pleurostoma richardsiae TaxID=41990 RepID=A0AA38REM1_9PEZI|nr:Pre-mRNA-splicing factor cwf19 [Pleurostoma richardsiae]
MDGLDEFEKQLAAEKAREEREAQDEAEKRSRRHRHRHRHHRDRSSERHGGDKGGDRDRTWDSERERHHRSRVNESDEEGHRHKRSRHSRDDDDERRHTHRRRDKDDDRKKEQEGDSEEPSYLKPTDPKEKLPLPDEEVAANEAKPLVRDSWMTGSIELDYVHRGGARPKSPPTKQEVKRVIHKNELNTTLQDINDGKTIDDLDLPQPEVEYTFGDAGSQWRMTKLKGVYTIAEQTGRPIDEVAEERFGSLREFDDAREEKIEMDRRKAYGEGYVGKEKPTGELYRERLAKALMRQPKTEAAPAPENDVEQGVVIPDEAPPVDQSTLNRLRAQMMKAKLRKAPDAEKLEAEYNAALASFNAASSTDQNVVLDAMHNRMLAGPRGEVKAIETRRGRERGLVEEKEDMSLDDMVREERRTRGQQGGEGMRLAERIAKDAKFDDDLEYLDENAEKLAKRVHKSEVNLKNAAISEFQKMNRILDTCPLCHHEDRNPPQSLPIAPIVSLGTRVYLTLPTEPELTGAEGGAVIVPISHRLNLLECDDDEWEEIRNFMKSLTRLYHDQGREVLFYENAAAPQRRLHAAMVVVPIPYDLGDTAPAFFREAMLSSDEEWSQHKKIIDTGKQAREGLGKLSFRRSIAKEMPYFHVWFTLDGGLGHVVEDSGRWPKGDLFAREILGGMMDVEPNVIKRQGRWSRSDPRLEDFRKRWRKFDWTRVLTEG